eukprot:5545806-Amphidinium_carterae.1
MAFGGLLRQSDAESVHVEVPLVPNQSASSSSETPARMDIVVQHATIGKRHIDVTTVHPNSQTVQE